MSETKDKLRKWSRRSLVTFWTCCAVTVVFVTSLLCNHFIEQPPNMFVAWVWVLWVLLLFANHFACERRNMYQRRLDDQVWRLRRIVFAPGHPWDLMMEDAVRNVRVGGADTPVQAGRLPDQKPVEQTEASDEEVLQSLIAQAVKSEPLREQEISDKGINNE